jgi:hypothetical protein
MRWGSFGPQNASTQAPFVVLDTAYAPNAPLLITTEPVPLSPTPYSRNLAPASSILACVTGNGIERSPKASSAFGLYLSENSAQEEKAVNGHLRMDIDGRTSIKECSSSGTHLSYRRCVSTCNNLPQNQLRVWVHRWLMATILRTL